MYFFREIRLRSFYKVNTINFSNKTVNSNLCTAAWIALAVSIITPAISLLLNNIHQRKLKKTELKNALIIKQYDEMKNVIIEYHKCVSTKLHMISAGAISEYELAYRKLFLFVPNEHWETLEKFNKTLLSNIDSASIQEQYLEITEILASLLQETQRRIPT